MNDTETQEITFKEGDRVYHPRRCEWGTFRGTHQSGLAMVAFDNAPGTHSLVDSCQLRTTSDSD